MTINSFLASLPSLLGILGFVIYHILGRHQKGDPVTLRLLEKLRLDSPERFTSHDKLNSKQLYDLISKDTSLRNKISDQDFILLQQVLKHNFVISIVVYLVCTVLFLSGIALYVYQSNKPIPVNINNIQLSNTNHLAEGLPVDLDTLKIQWVSSGKNEDVKVYLENVDTNIRSKEISASVHDNYAEITPEEYKPILSRRQINSFNRVKVVIQSSENSFTSKTKKLYVGLTILGVVFDNKVSIAATIDNSLVQHYNFEALLVAYKNGDIDTISLGQDGINGKSDYPINNINEYNWRDAKLTYLGPDSQKLIRTDILHD